MQTDLAALLAQKNHLAALGLAVSKINHDLRNLLTSAQLFSERLAKVADPHVQRFAPQLMRALERAIAFCQSTLSYGRVQEPPPDRRMMALEPLVESCARDVGPRWAARRALDQRGRARAHGGCRSRPAVPHSAQSRAQCRCRHWKAGRQRIPAATRSALPAGARARLSSSRSPTPAPAFRSAPARICLKRFQGSTRAGSAGLGLAIAAELVRAHGGDIRLVEGTIGATFRLPFPIARLSSPPGAASAQAHRRRGRYSCAGQADGGNAAGCDDAGSRTMVRTAARAATQPCQWALKPIARAFPDQMKWSAHPLPRTIIAAPVAQLDRAPDYESGGRRVRNPSGRANQFNGLVKYSIDFGDFKDRLGNGWVTKDKNVREA